MMQDKAARKRTTIVLFGRTFGLVNLFAERYIGFFDHAAF